MTFSADNPRLASYALEAGEGDKTQSFNMLIRELANAQQTGGEFSLIEMSGAKGLAAPPHSHGNESESFYILDGSIRVFVDDIDVLARPGDFVYIPKDARHKFTIESSWGRFLCLISPGGFENFFKDLGAPAHGPYPPNPANFVPFPTVEQILEVAPKYNWSLLEDW